MPYDGSVGVLFPALSRSLSTAGAADSVRGSYSRTCVLLLTSLVSSLLPALIIALLLDNAPALGSLRWVALFTPLALAGTLLIAATYFLCRCPDPAHLRPPHRLVVGTSATLFVLLATLLAIGPPLLSRMALVSGTAPGDVLHSNVLRQRALRHPDSGERREAARTIYLHRGERIVFRGPRGEPLRFDPASSDRRRHMLTRWLAARPGATPAEARLIATGDLGLIALSLSGLLVAAHLGRRHRTEPVAGSLARRRANR